MNDEWSRCPICFEDYSPTHRPTTFVCGHSTCIDHVIGVESLRECMLKNLHYIVYKFSFCRSYLSTSIETR